MIENENLVSENVNEPAPETEEYLLQIKNLRKYFPIGKTFLKKNQQYLKAVDGISFNLKAGKTVGIVGESGCGKTTMGRTILRLYEPTDGEILFEGIPAETTDLRFTFDYPATHEVKYFKIKDIKSQIAFGPYLAIGSIISCLYCKDLISIYFNLFLN